MSSWFLGGNPLVVWITEHPAIFATILYMYVSVIGSTYLWMLFRGFGVNVFDFAEANDFLTAAFKQPGVIPTGIMGVAGFALFWPMSRGFTRRDGQKSRNIVWMGSLVVVMMFLYTFGSGFLFAWEESQAIRRGWGTYVHIDLTTRADTPKTFPKSASMLLGTTDKFMILYEPVAQRSHIVPMASIARMRVCQTSEPLLSFIWGRPKSKPCVP